MKYVQNIRGKWCVRMVVPDDLVPIIGKRELRETDLPSEPRARERQAHAVINRFFAQLDEAREHLVAKEAANRPTLSSAAKEFYREELLVDDQGRAAAAPDAGGQIMNADVKEFLRESRAAYSNSLRLVAAGSASAEEAERDVGYGADYLAKQNRAPDVPRAELLRVLAEVQLEVLAQMEARDEGKLNGPAVKHPLLTQADPDPVPEFAGADPEATLARGMILSEALAAFHKERSAGRQSLAERTMEEHRNAVRMFNEFVGHDVPVSAIKKKDVIDYKNALLRTPVRYTMRFPGLTLPQAIKANEKRKEPHAALAPKTINMKWLSHLTTVLQWASNNGHIETNPAQGIRVDTGSKAHWEASYLPFTKDELKKIFSADIFNEPQEYGLKQWATLIMLYTGVRNSSEMSRMQLANI
uniref:hypothetical protein n=1 Tax=Mangrovicoccus ximenensis TaxID=1911570 RepID=UPI0011AE8577